MKKTTEEYYGRRIIEMSKKKEYNTIGVSLTEFARIFEIAPSTASNIVSVFEAKGILKTEVIGAKRVIYFVKKKCC